jgi:hypothetical protein
MALSERVLEVRAIASRLWFLPPPARNPIADKLHGLGIRVHPELATLELKREGPAELGNHAPQYPVSKTADQQGMEVLRTVDPALAAKIDAYHADRDIAARIRAAKTDAERVQLARELGIDVPDDVFAAVDELKAKVDDMTPEDFE